MFGAPGRDFSGLVGSSLFYEAPATSFSLVMNRGFFLLIGRLCFLGLYFRRIEQAYLA